MFRAPDFWAADSASPWPLLLCPLALLYSLGNRLNRRFTTPRQNAIPVISVGNLVAGGAGKTPTALALALLLRRLGHTPHFVSRGYGGKLRGPIQVDLQRHSAADTGDEPLLLAKAAPTWIARDRPLAVQAAAKGGASCVIVDDAHQTYRLQRTISILVVDADYGFGNGRLLPAGPLRESLGDGLSRSDAVVVLGNGMAKLPDFGPLPVFRADLVPDPQDAQHLQGKRVLAFAGIARPEKFFASLDQAGAILVQRRAFPDHAAYDEDLVMRLVEAAQAENALPVTTAKDLVRFPPEARPMVACLNVSLRFRDEPAVAGFLQGRVRLV